ncbi:MAG: TolC family protein [Bacteroidaceae bacterium]|nr:TolC family protein [Bacteroidaceae bacterium]
MRKAFIISVLILSIQGLFAQSLTYKPFIESVMSNNQAYCAEKLNVPISEALYKASKAIQNPSLSATYGNNSDWKKQMGQSVELEVSQPITFGVISARKQVAKNEAKIASTNLDDYLLNLKAEATVSFIEALLARDLSLIANQTYQNMQHLASGDSLRFVKGDISEYDMLQTRIEARMAQQDYLSTVASYNNCLVALDLYTGNPTRGTSAIEGQLSNPNKDYTIAELTEIAQRNRPDLKSALQSVTLAESQARLVKRERLPEVELSLGMSINSEVRNEIAPAPKYTGYTAGVSMPLPFSNTNKGNIRASQLSIQQSQLQAEALENQMISEIMQALNNYHMAQRNAKTYTEELIHDAEKILQGRIYAYQRGETSLIEVLAAQETYNEVRKNYAEALSQCMTAWVELQKVTGLLDIEI